MNNKEKEEHEKIAKAVEDGMFRDKYGCSMGDRYDDLYGWLWLLAMIVLAIGYFTK